ncbi:MAG: sulfite exporter TauE/SafE family protein [Planctomycetes bacterium]|nr:sulfite exporter TauE/SafE family protein [Planctomycetota bacterium]
MSGEWLLALGSALWFGVLTSISPCPLASNIAAISFIAQRLDRPRAVVVTGMLYALGRTAVYVALAALLVSSLLSAPAVSHALQRYVNKAIGPLLILVGMVLLGLLEFQTRGSALGARVGRHAERWGIWGGLLLGLAFALAFCPSSAALFFGSLVPLSVKCESRLALPLVYGVGTALPVVLFALAVAAGAGATGRAFRRVAQFERWARNLTGVVFILVGVYFSLVYVFRIL